VEVRRVVGARDGQIRHDAASIRWGRLYRSGRCAALMERSRPLQGGGRGHHAFGPVVIVASTGRGAAGAGAVAAAKAGGDGPRRGRRRMPDPDRKRQRHDNGRERGNYDASHTRDYATVMPLFLPLV
jgi:hypothetical protein